MAINVSITSPSTFSACASFTATHGLGSAPVDMPEILMTTLGEISFRSPFYDSTYFYLTASGINLTAIVKVEP